ncbi:MAG: hypothetical protein SOZ60_04105, partial [Prevotella sp.]|nr:hypothetical protein [Prevotella sp.]
YIECLPCAAVMPVAECLAPQRTAEWLWHQLSLNSVTETSRRCEAASLPHTFLMVFITLSRLSRAYPEWP